MVEYVKSLVTEIDVKEGGVYQVSSFENGKAWVTNAVGDAYVLISGEYEPVPNPETTDTNPFIKTVTERKFVPGYFEAENGGEIYIALEVGCLNMQIEDFCRLTKNDIIKLAKYLNEIAEIME